MGLCISSVSTESQETVKLIFPNGDLQEFSWSVRPSYILGKEGSFMCDSDTLEIDLSIKAVGGDTELRLGQIYFVLPKSLLNRPLKADEMAQLVVRASNALGKINRGRKGRKGVIVPLNFSMEEKEENFAKRKIVGQSFKSDLSTIAE